ncbi:MAG TPA: carboxypeptidase-like regulatory domain-containing protein, partial [Candidatus Acidoferrum sp.]|nr:carboxypeptidase-like regulatory domain-containing protein [Candidatus Acidoferrum sp.]
MTAVNFLKRRLGILLVLCLAIPIASVAQSTTFGAIGGTVMDKTKAVVPNATVTAINNGTGATATAASDSFGGFRIINLGPGTYTVSVKAPSFADYKVTGVIVE